MWALWSLVGSGSPLAPGRGSCQEENCCGPLVADTLPVHVLRILQQEHHVEVEIGPCEEIHRHAIVVLESLPGDILTPPFEAGDVRVDLNGNGRRLLRLGR